MDAIALLLVLATCQEAVPRALTWDEFPVFVWREEREKQPLSERFRLAFGATNLGRGDDSRALLEQGAAFYVDNAAGRDDLHLDRDPAYERHFERWYRTRDDALLVRRPCLNDPRVLERLRSTLERTLQAHAANPGLGLSLGDEVSFTPYGSPEDTCLCADCRAAWREFLAGAGGAREGLPSDFDMARASTDAARLALESGGPPLVQAWLARRSFTQAVVQTRLAELARQARASAPQVRLGLLGMIGRTAFGGVAIDRILPQLDFAECYRVSDARELLFTLRAGGQRVVQTIFFDERCAAAPTWFAWESWMRGADGLVLWSDRELARHPAYADALEAAVHRIRSVESRAAGFDPRPRGVALVNDEDSTAYGWLVDAGLDGPTWPRRLQGWQEERGSRERSLRAWLRALEDCGAMPGALPLASVGASTVERFPVLVLNHLRVLDDGGAARLEAFLSAKGKLLVRGELGAVDARGQKPRESRLEALRARHPAAILEFGGELDRYLEERLDGGAAVRERLQGLLRETEGALSAWRMTNEGAALPWLSTWSGAVDGSLLCACLPNLPEKQDREGGVATGTKPTQPRLREIQATLHVPVGFEVEWLHPPAAGGREVRLPAGEAAVFRLRKSQSR